MGTKKKRRHFTPEYKAEVVRLVRAGGKTAGQAARDLDLTETSVRAWVRQAEIDAGKGGAGAIKLLQHARMWSELSQNQLDRCSKLGRRLGRQLAT